MITEADLDRLDERANSTYSMGRGVTTISLRDLIALIAEVRRLRAGSIQGFSLRF